MGGKGKEIHPRRVADMLSCSIRHVQNLFHRGDLDGYFKGRGKGLMIYEDSVINFKSRDCRGEDFSAAV